jgi:SAM-dependent methyltransferase
MLDAASAASTRSRPESAAAPDRSPPQATDPAFRAGVLARPAYDAAVASPRFARMEAFSAAFLAANRSALARYARRWSPDPLHHVMRQWEYPFVVASIERLARESGSPPRRLLDAGSGATFFPYFVAEAWPDAIVDCCDYDAMPVATLTRIVHPAAGRVRARQADLHALPYETESFDVVYCISVLEHTRDYRRILDEFRRVLRPGGGLILTCDVSVDGRTDIPRAGAADLLSALGEQFEAVDAPTAQSLDALDRPDAVTTGNLRSTHAHLMPWRRTWRTFVGAFLRGRYPHRQFYDVGIASGVYRRR